MTHQAPVTRAVRHDGWTPARVTQFLDHLASDGSVRSAASRVGMRREEAYRLRRRDAAFARAWNAALVLAREASAEVLACRAIDGVEEDIWFRGELVGTRRKYDSRLLLAHMARLDRIADDPLAGRDAARFDELLAVVGGERAPDGCESDDEGMTLDREFHIESAVEDAEVALAETWHAEHPESSDEELAEMNQEEVAAQMDREVANDWALSEALADERLRARLAAGIEWDDRRARSHAAVDRLLTEPLFAQDSVPSVPIVSPSPAEPVACAEEGAEEAQAVTAEVPSPDTPVEAPSNTDESTPQREPRFDDFLSSRTPWPDYYAARKAYHQAQLKKA